MLGDFDKIFKKPLLFNSDFFFVNLNLRTPFLPTIAYFICKFLIIEQKKFKRKLSRVGHKSRYLTKVFASGLSFQNRPQSIDLFQRVYKNSIQLKN